MLNVNASAAVVGTLKVGIVGNGVLSFDYILFQFRVFFYDNTIINLVYHTRVKNIE